MLQTAGSKVLKIDPSSFVINEQKILRSLQVPVEKADDFLLDMICMLKEKCKDICKPLAAYSWYNAPEFNTETSSLTLEGITFSPGKIITHALKKSTSIVFFIGTCGFEVEKLSKKYASESHLLESFILDLIGSEIAEEVAELLHASIGKQAKEYGYHHTNRYSPGYCGWHVSEQQKLFFLLKETCGVTLTPSSLMVPIKSVSGMVGVGPDVKFQGYSCAKCDVNFCIYRDNKK